LQGNGCTDIKSKASGINKTSAAAMKNGGGPGSPVKKAKAKDDGVAVPINGDPISASIKERKDAGSIVALVKREGFAKPADYFAM
jgi:hypothetical protein